MFSFDIKSGYHHVPIFPPHQSFLGFSWFYKGKTKYFCFWVLPFGLSSAPYIFTKVFTPLVAYWRQQGIHTVVYLDDVLGKPLRNRLPWIIALRVKSDLVHSGFVPNSEKSIWVPTLVIDCWVSPSISSRVCFLSQGRKSSMFCPTLILFWKLIVPPLGNSLPLQAGSILLA